MLPLYLRSIKGFSGSQSTSKSAWSKKSMSFFVLAGNDYEIANIGNTPGSLNFTYTKETFEDPEKSIFITEQKDRDESQGINKDTSLFESDSEEPNSKDSSSNEEERPVEDDSV